MLTGKLVAYFFQNDQFIEMLGIQPVHFLLEMLDMHEHVVHAKAVIKGIPDHLFNEVRGCFSADVAVDHSANDRLLLLGVTGLLREIGKQPKRCVFAHHDFGHACETEKGGEQRIAELIAAKLLIFSNLEAFFRQPPADRQTITEVEFGERFIVAAEINQRRFIILMTFFLSFILCSV